MAALGGRGTGRREAKRSKYFGLSPRGQMESVLQASWLA